MPSINRDNGSTVLNRSKATLKAWRTRRKNEAAQRRKVTARKQNQYVGKAFSTLQPWATAIAFAGKDVENRPLRTHYRGPVAIHGLVSLAASRSSIPLSRRSPAPAATG